jgi:uncharacterized membrane protein
MYRTALLALIASVVLGWPVEVAIALTAAMVVVTALSPGKPNSPSIIQSVPRPIFAFLGVCTGLMFLAVVWHLIALFFADDSRDLAAPISAFVVTSYSIKGCYWWASRTLSGADPDDG